MSDINHEVSEIIADMAKKMYNSGYKKGALYVISVLDETMLATNSKVVLPLWLDTIRNEIEKRD